VAEEGSKGVKVEIEARVGDESGLGGDRRSEPAVKAFSATAATAHVPWTF
jgi:hypothetical protein